ncbi:Hsp20/alpha crystallin family protein [Chitinophagaceae bacterium 26-R-25]|nr:Hsp20/alpha crystallin family protein [Chitinophagaceae bacterium 26-R-25]
METQAITKSKWPSLFDNTDWFDTFFNAPLDKYFNRDYVLNVPAVNVNETETTYAISIAAPGLEKNDFHVQIQDGMITVSAEKEEKLEKDGKYNRREYNYTSWTRSFSLPEDADDEKIEAEYKNGELKIDVPRNGKKPKANIKNITIG